LFRDSRNCERVCKTISSFNAIWDLLLRRSIEVNDGRWETIGRKGVIESLGFQQVKTLALITLQDEERNLLPRGPAFNL
jgi:hypothetical protein